MEIEPVLFLYSWTRFPCVCGKREWGQPDSLAQTWLCLSRDRSDSIGWGFILLRFPQPPPHTHTLRYQPVRGYKLEVPMARSLIWINLPCGSANLFTHWITISYDQSRQYIKKQRHYFAKKGPSSQSYGCSSIHVWMWELDLKESWGPKNWCFWTMILEKTLGSPLDCNSLQTSQS